MKEFKRSILKVLGIQVSIRKSGIFYHLDLASREILADQILAAFKAYIASLPKPENPNKTFVAGIWEAAIEADRKALMESLE